MKRIAFWKRPFVRSHQDGQAAFEFLLILPLLIGFFLLMIDFGIAMYEYVSISNAVREGARYAAVNCETGTCIPSVVETWTTTRTGGLTIPTTEVAATWSGPNRGDSVAVSVNHTYGFIFWSPLSLNLHACSEMRLEQQDRTGTLGGGGTC